LSACSAGQDPSGATQVIHASRKSTVNAPVVSQATTTALFQPQRGILPYPTDSYFAGSTDGTLNIQPESAQLPGRTAVDALDGFSTTAAIRARFSASLDPASLTARSVVVLQVSIDSTTKAVTGVVRQLVFGTDYTTAVESEPGGNNNVLEIQPTHPLTPSTGTANNGYLVLLTRAIADSAGKLVAADGDYATIKSSLPTCSAVASDSLYAICQVTATHLQVAQAMGINPADVVLSFSFSTESISDSLATIAKSATAQQLTVHSTGLTTAQVNPMLSGHATVHVGTLNVPYYLSRNAPLSGYWQGNPSALDVNSRALTRFNPAPVPTETLQVPVLVTVPNANSAGGGMKSGKWPVLIFQHGFGRSRTDMLSVADAFADSGFVVVAIDLPLHGITDTASLLYASRTNPLYAGLSLPPTGSIERTFDLDVYNNKSGAAGADGRIDSSGASFINLTSLLTTRDNMREGAADLITLLRSLPGMSLDGDSEGDVDPTNIHFLGHSLGSMVGTLFLAVVPNTEVGSATLAMPGGGLADLLRDSATFGPKLAAGQSYMRDAQTVWDAGDPVNYMTAAGRHPIHVLQIVGSPSSPADQVVPNSATRRLIETADLVRIAAPPALGTLTSPRSGYTNFVIGDHQSLVDPTASLAATIEMQAEAISFAGAPVPPIPQMAFQGTPATHPGSAILVLNPPVIQP
jgi:pimeloyl-ACP methyl ester carboxylesterase